MCAYTSKSFFERKKYVKRICYHMSMICHAETKISDRNFCRISFFADFPANFAKFQICAERSVFVVQKRLLYKIASNFNETQNAIIVK